MTEIIGLSLNAPPPGLRPTSPSSGEVFICFPSFLLVFLLFYPPVNGYEEFYRKKAREKGITESQTGSVTVIQRVGSALNLNPHFHTLCPDGVFARDDQGSLIFLEVGSITDEDVAQVLSGVRTRVLDLLEGEGLLDESDASFQFDELSEASPSLAGIYSASVQGRVALGQRSGRRVMRVGSDPNSPWVTSRTPLQAHLEGFDLHAAVSIGGDDRARLERLCRYILRPPVAQNRLELRDDSRIELELKTPFWDGTTHVLFEPLELLEKVAAAIPRPRVNQLIYAGVLGPNAKWRKEVVAFGRASPDGDAAEAEAEGDDGQSDSDEKKNDGDHTSGRRKSYTWAELMARIFLIDVLECQNCGGRMKVIAAIEDPDVIRKILVHLGLPTDIPTPVPPRSQQSEFDEIVYDLDSL